MDVKVEDISSVRKKLSFEIAAEKVDAEFEKAYRKIARTAKIKGFRPGKAPRSVIEQYYAPQLEQQALEQLIGDSYVKALAQHRMEVVSEPEIVESGILERGKSFNYQAQVEVKPEVQARDYFGLTLQKELLAIDEKVVPERLEELRASRSELKVSEREEAKIGDFVVIGFEGFLDGQPFPGGRSDEQVFELGSGSLIPGFEEQLQGMRRGEEREIAVTFPADYGNKELAGRPAIFKVSLQEIKEKVFPELNDDFARGFGLENLAELEEKIRENYRAQEMSRIEGDVRERLMKALIARNPIEVPESMIARQLDYMLGNIRRRLQGQGMSLEVLGMNEESFRRLYREGAVAQVQGTLVLEAIARQENLQVEEGEIEEKMAQIARMSNASLASVKAHFAGDEARRGLLAQALEEKAMGFLLQQSNINEVEKSELADTEKTGDKE